MSENNKLFKVGDLVSVDTETGEAVPIEGGGFRMLPGPPGTCEWCHVKHDPGDLHNRDSLSYQVKFHAIHGRDPTWTDAMAHCTPEIKAKWRKAIVLYLRARKLDIPDDLKEQEQE